MSISTSVAQCLPGEVAVGGGFHNGGNGTEGPLVISAPVSGADGQLATGWEVAFVSTNANKILIGCVNAMCAS